MDSIWSYATEEDSSGVLHALRMADNAWRGADLERALHWVERAAAIAAGEGHSERAIELACRAKEVDREVKRRSGMPDRSDPAWHEARRLQSSLIEVRDSWLDPIEVGTEHVEGLLFDDRTEREVDVEQLSPTSFDDDGSIPIYVEDLLPIEDGPPLEQAMEGFRRTVPDLHAETRARRMLEATIDSSWNEEAPTLRMKTRDAATSPTSQRDTVRPPLGSLNELTLLTELERAGAPGTRLPSLVQTIRLRDATEQDYENVYNVLRHASVFEDLSEDKTAELVRAGTMIRLASQASLSDYQAAVVIDGSASIMQARGGEALRTEVGDAICFEPSVRGLDRPKVLAQTAASVAIAWRGETLDQVLSVCPWIVASLRARADELVTLSAIPLRQVARRMSTTFRKEFLEASRILFMPPGAVLFEESMEVHSLIITGAGEVELVDHDGTVQHVHPGTLLFATELVEGAVTKQRARAGERGATVLHTEAVELARFLPHVPLLSRALSRPD